MKNKIWFNDVKNGNQEELYNAIKHVTQKMKIANKDYLALQYNYIKRDPIGRIKSELVSEFKFILDGHVAPYQIPYWSNMYNFDTIMAGLEISESYDDRDFKLEYLIDAFIFIANIMAINYDDGKEREEYNTLYDEVICKINQAACCLQNTDEYNYRSNSYMAVDNCIRKIAETGDFKAYEKSMNEILESIN